jgi:hypothetical protein
MAKQGNAIPQWLAPNIEPKRKFKFILSFGDIPAWVVKTAGRPNITVSAGATHHFMAHQFKFPGRIEYNDIQIALVDPIEPDIASVMFQMIKDAGYVLPSDWNQGNEGWKKSFSKLNSVNATKGDISIKTIDAAGRDVEKWTLHNAWVKEVNFDDVGYDSEDLMSITVTLTYDYAKHELFSNE